MNLANYQQRVRDWGVRCFGERIGLGKTERNYRFLEEALELVQSNGLDRILAHQLVDYVYDRPPGDLKQEVGGSIVTLSLLCSGASVDLSTCADAELRRIEGKVEAIRAKQAAKPIRMREGDPR